MHVQGELSEEEKSNQNCISFNTALLDQRTNSIEKILYLYYQALHVVVHCNTLHQDSLKMKQHEEGRSVALSAIIVQSPI